MNLGAVIWVSGTERLGQSISHRPSAPAISVPLVEYNQNELCTLFIHIHVPRPFWEHFSQYDLSCLMLVR